VQFERRDHSALAVIAPAPRLGWRKQGTMVWYRIFFYPIYLSMNLSDRDRPTCTSEAGLVAAPPIAPRSLKLS
jgi:hypothetical protein